MTSKHIFDWGSLKPFGVAVGCIDNDAERIDLVIDSIQDSNAPCFICVDIAHGDSDHVVRTLEYIRPKTKAPIIAGNVATREGARRLFAAGADLVKVGVGPGSVCTTRTQTGCGFPQITAISSCAEEGPVIADGGIRTPGDAAKAIAAGATLVMIGGMFAGCQETPPGIDYRSQLDKIQKRMEEDIESGRRYSSTKKFPGEVEFRGMASKEAREDFTGDFSNAEGVSVRVPINGTAKEVVSNIMDGIRSSMSYTGFRTLDEFRQFPSFVIVSPNCVKMNGAHHGT